MSRWREEYYSDCGIKTVTDDDEHVNMKVRDLAIRPWVTLLYLFLPSPSPAGKNTLPPPHRSILSGRS